MVIPGHKIVRAIFRVQVYDNDGRFLRSFGNRGQGPGEFVRPRGLAVVGDRVVVEDISMRRLSHFDLEGNPFGETALDSEMGFFEGEGSPGGDIVALKQEMVQRGIFTRARLVRLSQEGVVTHSYARPVSRPPCRGRCRRAGSGQ